MILIICSIHTVEVRKINTGYAQYYNRVHNRHGYLFQDRYKSIPTREINYFRELVCYIHLNPLRGGIVKTINELNSYNWSSHRGFTGRQELPWMHLNDALLHFGHSLEEGQKQYFKYLALVLAKCKNQDECFNPWMNSSNVGLPNNKVIDDKVSVRDPEFVVASVKTYNNHLRRRRELLKQGWNVERLVNHVSTLFKLSKHDILSNTKKEKIVNARSLIYYWAIHVLGLSAISVARYFGHSCSTAIRSAEKGKVLVDKNSFKLSQ